MTYKICSFLAIGSAPAFIQPGPYSPVVSSLPKHTKYSKIQSTYTMQPPETEWANGDGRSDGTSARRVRQSSTSFPV